MTCPFEQEVLLLDSEAVLRGRVELEAHAKQCADCVRVLTKLRSMRAATRALPVAEPRAGLRAEMAMRAERAVNAGSAAWLPRFGPAVFVAAAVVAVVILWAAARDPDAGGVGTRVLEARAVLELGPARLRAERTSRVRAESERKIVLDDGELEIAVAELEPPQELIVATPHTEIEVAESASFQVDVTRARTEVAVLSGRVEVGKREAHAGATVRVPPGPETAAEKMQEATTALEKDPPEAARLALAVLSGEKDTATELRAIALVADARRRSGELEDAAGWYAKLIAHAHGAAYVEEASYQRAKLMRALGRDADARAALKIAMPSNALLPERLALEAELTSDPAERSRLYRSAAEAARKAGDEPAAKELEVRAGGH